MGKDRKKADWLVVAGLVLAVAIVPLMLYLLSVGPALLLNAQGYLSDATFERIYWPVILSVQRFGWIAAVLRWYAALWRGY